MKRFLLLTALIISCIFLSECRKDPKPDVFRVTEVDVMPSYKTAEIRGTYTFNTTPDDMKIIYGEKSDLAGAISFNVSVDVENFFTKLNNLKPETKYYYCFECYASHSSTRSEVHSFSTLKAEKPIVETSEINNVTINSAIGGGNVVSSVGEDVTARGVCWSVNINPTLNDEYTIDSLGEGVFVSRMYNLKANTTYYVRAYATNAVGTSYGEEVSFTTLKEEEEGCGPDGEIDGYDYVDLGLPSGLKWATHNIGAITPEGYGNYYAWGETTTKSDYSLSNSLTYRLSISQLQSQGYIDGSGNLTPSHDAATANWGNNWRMPTRVEMEELVEECTWQWTTQNGVNGCKVTGPNGSCIFLPAAGYCYGSLLSSARESGYYWSSTPYESLSNRTYRLLFSSSDQGVDWGLRYYGRSVRPVSE